MKSDPIARLVLSKVIARTRECINLLELIEGKAKETNVIKSNLERAFVRANQLSRVIGTTDDSNDY